MCRPAGLTHFTPYLVVRLPSYAKKQGREAMFRHPCVVIQLDANHAWISARKDSKEFSAGLSPEHARPKSPPL